MRADTPGPVPVLHAADRAQGPAGVSSTEVTSHVSEGRTAKELCTYKCNTISVGLQARPGAETRRTERTDHACDRPGHRADHHQRPHHRRSPRHPVTPDAVLVLRSADGEDVELPTDLQRVLLHTLASIARGGEVTIGRMPEELISTVAAEHAAMFDD